MYSCFIHYGDVEMLIHSAREPQSYPIFSFFPHLSHLSILPHFLLPHQWGRLRHPSNKSGFRELRHAATLCPSGEQDPSALSAPRCAYRSGRGRSGCKLNHLCFIHGSNSHDGVMRHVFCFIAMKC